MTRILIGADTFPPDVNGAARFAERLAVGLAGRGHDVHVVAPSPDGPAGVHRHGGVTVHRVRSHRYPLHENFRVCLPWQARPATARLVRELRPDVVHVQAHFVVGRGAAVAASEAGIPLVATNHFMPENLVGHARLPRGLHDLAARAAWWDARRVLARADAVTAPTPRAVELLATATGLPARAISCGIDTDRYAGGSEDPVPTVLFVGRLDQEKRVDELLRAFASVLRRRPPAVPPCRPSALEPMRQPSGAEPIRQASPAGPRAHRARLEIVGDGAERDRWKSLARDLGLVPGRDVVFRGFVSEPELLDAYRRCAVFCMPGVAELQSLVTLEAMAAGRPVVAADAMALPHLVRPGRNGWLYPPGDVGALAAALEAVLRDSAARRRMGAESRRIVAGHAMGATLDAFEALYGEVLGAPLRPVPRPLAA